MQPARKQEILISQLGLMYPGLKRSPGLVSDFKLDWPMSFLLHHNGPGRHLHTMGYVADPELRQITSPQLAVDGQIEKS